MKKRILGILIAALALSMVFAMISCGGGDKKPANVTITFENGGVDTNEAIPDPITIARDATLGELLPGALTEKVTPPAAVTQVFDGWVIKGKTTKVDDKYKFGSSMTITATWRARDASKIIVNFVNGYDPLQTYKSVEIAKGGKLTAGDFPANPTRSNYAFVKWVDEHDAHVDANYTFGQVDAVVIAEWELTNFITITFNANHAGAEPNWTIKIEENTPIGPLPAPEYWTGWAFVGWYSAATGGVKYDENSSFEADTTLYAHWVEDVLTPDGAFELLYLQNGASAVYGFPIPVGHNLTEYKEISVKYKVSAAALAVWDKPGVGLFHARLQGVYPANASFIAAGDNPTYGLPAVNYIPRTTHATPYILDNKAASAVRTGVEADEWFTVTYDLSGANAHGEFVQANKPAATDVGTVYFALGLACQTTNAGADRDRSFIQLVKDIKLVPTSSAPEVSAIKPPAAYGQFVCYNAPIVFEWRADPTDAHIRNWLTLVPAVPESPPFDRGPIPSDDALSEVVLGTAGPSLFTYINGGQVNNQLGWVSFGEAGRANSQTSTVPSTISKNNFTNAWYLVLNAANAPTGTLKLVWMGDARGWIETEVTGTTGEAKDGVSWITGDDTEGYVIKILLTEMSQYQVYYEGNSEWVGLALSYWGATDSAINDLIAHDDKTGLGITKAALLVETTKKEGAASGVSLGLSFTLGTAPEGGAAIDDVIVNSTGTLIVSAAPGLTDRAWYINGAKDASTGVNLSITSPSTTEPYIVSLQAKRGGKWISQTVVITVEE